MTVVKLRGEISIQCGEEAAAQFALAPGYRNLNHGKIIYAARPPTETAS